MGRLIDGTIQALPMSNYILERKETFIRVLENGDNDFLFAMLMEYFDKQPTAYDIEKVVARMEKEKEIHTEHYNISLYKKFPDVKQKYKQIQLVINKDIEIVRKGGVK